MKCKKEDVILFIFLVWGKSAKKEFPETALD